MKKNRKPLAFGSFDLAIGFLPVVQNLTAMAVGVDDGEVRVFALEALQENIGVQAGVLSLQQEGQVEEGAVSTDLFHCLHQGDNVHLGKTALSLLAALADHKALTLQKSQKSLCGLGSHGGVKLQGDVVYIAPSLFNRSSFRGVHSAY